MLHISDSTKNHYRKRKCGKAWKQRTSSWCRHQSTKEYRAKLKAKSFEQNKSKKFLVAFWGKQQNPKRNTHLSLCEKCKSKKNFLWRKFSLKWLAVCTDSQHLPLYHTHTNIHRYWYLSSNDKDKEKRWLKIYLLTPYFSLYCFLVSPTTHLKLPSSTRCKICSKKR